MKIKILSFLLFFSTALYAQDLDSLKSTLKPRKFIDKAEIFLGPNLSFNYGNKFIENYEDENVKNTRLLKWGYVAGVGVNHPVTKRIGLNVRLQYETKGTKNELNVPLNPVNDDTRLFITSEYTYHYITALALPQFSIGKKQRLKTGIGGYYSRIRKVKGYDQQLFEREDMQDTEIYFEGRIFRDLRDDGGVHGTSISRGLFEMEKDDYGLMILIAYNFLIRGHLIAIRLMNNFGLKDINRDNLYGLEEKNNNVSFTIAYQLQL